MSQHKELLEKLFRCINEHDHQGIASCYEVDATFRDIAFQLHGRNQIHAMWKMICMDDERGKSDIQVTVQQLSANDITGHAVVIDRYTYRDTKRAVVNEITSDFKFRNGLIVSQIDQCDPVEWASQAMGGIKGWVAGHVPIFRRRKAMGKLRRAFPEAFNT